MGTPTPAVADASLLLDDSEPLTDEQFDQLVQTVRGGVREREPFDEGLTAVVRKKKASLSRDGALALKAAQGLFALRRYAEAFEWLGWAGGSESVCWLKGHCLKGQGDYTGAIAAYEEAEDKGHDSFEVAMTMVDCLCRDGQIEEAEKKLMRASRPGEIRAQYHFQLGRLHEAKGEHEEAMDEYDRAIELDGNHTEALFYLAYGCDLYGDEKEAIKYYRQCVNSTTVHVSALLNLTVLYEEAGEYDKANACVQRVLAAYPNHPRARLFLKDIDSSTTMLYDEEQERQIDRRNQVLEIPISEFELSVRSRNCLKKMHIRTLGDLLKVSETELLAYKNFGETSLMEIKYILVQKGLRLGQMLEDHNSSLRGELAEAEAEQANQDEILAQPIMELKLSVRARKCLTRLNMQTMGDLVKCTEAELLGCKNFGQMSLHEITARLKEKNLSLRTLND